MAFAARLASKRKEAEEAGEDSGDKGLGGGGVSSLLQGGKDKEGDGQMRNPFADDEDDDEQSDDEDEEDDEGDLGRGDNAGGQGSSWNRGGWWRGALGNRKEKKETFGDGRDSTDSEDEAEGQGGDGGNSSDEEFGDFAMPESSGAAAESSGATPGFDAEREKVLVKPMPVHPPGGGGNKGNFLGLWPFAKKDKDSSPTKEEAAAEKEKTADSTAAAEKPVEAQAADEAAKEDKEKGATADEHAVEGDDKTKAEPPIVLSEDGEKVQPAVEAKRRTSIEEPDEGDEVVV